MSAGEFFEENIISHGAQRGDGDVAGILDRQNSVISAVRNEDARCAAPLENDGARGRESHDALEEITIRAAERKGVRGAVGEPTDCDAGRIDIHPVIRVQQCFLYVVNVGTEPTGTVIPGTRTRIGCNYSDAE